MLAALGVTLLNSTEKDFIIWCPHYSTGADFGGVSEAYNAANWTISEAPAVPEAEIPALLAMGGLMALVTKRRQVKAA